MFKKKITWIIIVALVVVGGIIYSRSRAPKVEYTTEDARRGDLVRTVSITGTLEGVQKASLSFQVSGRVEKILVSAGDDVRAGEMLAYLDQGEALSLYRQYQSDLRTAEENEALARRNWDSLKPEEREAKKLATEKAREALQGAYSDMKKTIIYAPFTGKVSKINIEEGEGAVLNTEVMEMVGNKGLEIESDVPESDIANISLGQNSKVSFDSLDQEDVFEAQVKYIESSSTVIQDVVYYKIKMDLIGTDERLKPGMSCDIDVNTAEVKDVIMIPDRAVKSEGDRKYVEILSGDSEVSRKYIETGLSGDDGLIEVKSGLVVGDRVITFSK